MPRIVGRLGSESKVVRAAALATIKGVFPELAAELRGYSPSEATEVCREKAAGLVARYPFNHERSARCWFRKAPVIEGWL